MDCETIIAGLLHDTVEDTDAVTFESIERQFGAGVRRIVEGETKVSKLGKIQRPKEGAPPQDVKAEDLRSLFCTMTQEVGFNGFLHWLSVPLRQQAMSNPPGSLRLLPIRSYDTLHGCKPCRSGSNFPELTCLSRPRFRCPFSFDSSI